MAGAPTVDEAIVEMALRSMIVVWAVVLHSLPPTRVIEKGHRDVIEKGHPSPGAITITSFNTHEELVTEL
jgi:hypothetical protein